MSICLGVNKLESVKVALPMEESSDSTSVLVRRRRDVGG